MLMNEFCYNASMSAVSPTIHRAFQAIAQKHPEKIAIAFFHDNGYRSLSYRELLNEVLSSVALLKAHSIKKNDHVALLLRSGPHWVKTFFACLELGAVIIPINPELDHTEIRYVLSHSDAQALITDEKSLPHIQAIVKESSLNVVVIDLNAPIIISSPDTSIKEPSEENNQGSSLACIIYTSGTTATPKGVQLSHQNLLANVTALQQLRFLSADDRLICLLPFYHAYPLMASLLLPLLSGASISFSRSLEADDIFECIQRTDISMIIAVPRLLALFKEKIEYAIHQLPFAKRKTLQALLALALFIRKNFRVNFAVFILKDVHEKFGPGFRYLVSGGAKLDEHVNWQFYQWGFTVLEGYGLTETAPVISFNTPAKNRIGSVGRPIPGVSVKIHQTDESGYGEIVAKGNNVFAGYYHERSERIGVTLCVFSKENTGLFYKGALSVVAFYFRRIDFLARA